MSPKINILMSSVGGELAPELLNNLKSYPDAEVTVFGIDNNSEAIGQYFCDYFIQVPKGSDPEFKNVISQVIKEHNINLLIPGSDEEALSFADLKKDLEGPTTQFACVRKATLDILSDKAASYKAFKEYDIPCADWNATTNFEDLKNECQSFRQKYSEFVVKPSVSRGGRDVFVIRDDINQVESLEGGRELHLPYDIFMSKYIDELQHKNEVIIMERLFGPVHDIDMLAKDGSEIYVIPRRRVNSVSPNSGHTIVKQDNMIEIGKKIISSFQLSWLYDCDLMQDRDGNPKVIEINPRMSGSVAVTMKAGVPLFHSVIDLYLGKNPKIVPTPFGAKVIPFKSLTKVEHE